MTAYLNKINEDTYDTCITFNQWENIEDFVELLVDKIDWLNFHSFTAKSKAQYLKDQRVELGNETKSILRDFAENYKYVVQDKI